MRVLRARVLKVTADETGALNGLNLSTGQHLPADAVFVGGGFRARVETLHELGVATTPHASGLGEVLDIDMRGQCSVPGIYAAGNVTDPGMQVLPSAAHGSQVGASIAFDLAGEDLRTAVDHRKNSGQQRDWDARYSGDQVWSGNPNGTLVEEVRTLPVGSALDIGAGEGGDALWLAQQGWDVTATDISAEALEKIRAQAHAQGLAVSLLRADANDLGAYGESTYDLVSLQYGAFTRTPDRRGIKNLLGGCCSGWSSSGGAPRPASPACNRPRNQHAHV